LMHPEDLQVPPPAPALKGQLREGVKYVLSTPLLRDILLMMAIVGTFTFEFQVSLPLIAEFTFQGDARSYAFLSGALGIGAVFGGLAIASQKRNTPSMLILASGLFGIAVLGAAFMPTLVLSGVGLVFSGVCSIFFTSLGNSVLQLKSSPQMRGRVMSFWSIAFLGSTTLGGPAVGWFAEAVGPRWGLGLGGIAALIAAVLGAIQFLPRRNDQE